MGTSSAFSVGRRSEGEKPVCTENYLGGDAPVSVRASPSRDHWLARAIERQLVDCEASDRRNAPYRGPLQARTNGT